MVYGHLFYIPVFGSNPLTGLTGGPATWLIRPSGPLFSLDHGLFIFSPLLLLAFKGLYEREVVLPEISAGIVTIFAFWDRWYGGYSYASRLVLTAVPFLVLLAFRFILKTRQTSWRLAFGLVVLFSVMIQFIFVTAAPEQLIAQGLDKAFFLFHTGYSNVFAKGVKN